MCVCVRVTSRHIISLSPCPLFTADQRMTTGLNAVLEKWKRPRQPNQFALQKRRWIKPVNSRKHWREKSTTILLWEEHQQIFTVPVLRSSKQMQIWPQSPQCRSRGHIPQRNRCPGKGTFWQPVLQPGRGRAADLAPKSGSTASKEPGSGADRPYPENPPTTTGCVCHEPHRQPRPARGLKMGRGVRGLRLHGFSPHTTGAQGRDSPASEPAMSRRQVAAGLPAGRARDGVLGGPHGANPAVTERRI